MDFLILLMTPFDHLLFRRQVHFLFLSVIFCIATKVAGQSDEIELLHKYHLKNVQLGVAVMDLEKDELVYQYRSRQNLIPASLQKILTSIATLELLGEKRIFQTVLRFSSVHDQYVIDVLPSWDPSLCSPAMDGAHSLAGIASRLVKEIGPFCPENASVLLRVPELKYHDPYENPEWQWYDIGNYYAAGLYPINYRENAIDLYISAAMNADGFLTISHTMPDIDKKRNLHSFVTRDKSKRRVEPYVLNSSLQGEFFIYGNLKKIDRSYKIKAAMSNPPLLFAQGLKEHLAASGWRVNIEQTEIAHYDPNCQMEIRFASPSLSDLVRYALLKSNNLFCEAFVSALAEQLHFTGSWQKGLKTLQEFWSDRGILSGELKMTDGSGLSVKNFCTPYAVVKALHYAQQNSRIENFEDYLPDISKSWVSSYDLDPRIKNLNVKTGSMGGVRNIAGFYKNTTNQRTYAFCIMLNHFNGSSRPVKQFLAEYLNYISQKI